MNNLQLTAVLLCHFILGLQPREKAAMLGVNTINCFLE